MLAPRQMHIGEALVRLPNGQIGLDVRIQQGALHVGKRVRLQGPDSNEAVEAVGVELLATVPDPSLIRIHCSKPKTLDLATGKTNGWRLGEE
jgi:hypothetical protein